MSPLRSLALLLVLAVAAPLSGCLDCQPQLDVRHCMPASTTCLPGEGDPVVDADDPVRGAEAFPGIRGLMETTPAGEHSHAGWNATLEEAFWAAHGIPLEQAGKQVFYRDGEALFRVRVLSCR
ncbi:MAG TPA: hypothetical protein VI796_01695 [Candidatus Thermoplasmatota archaeon]|nr:hypothetical protein [Candidatus Thermoplasmatota archaeon]